MMSIQQKNSFLFILLLICLLLAAKCDETDETYTFADFVRQFQKVYDEHEYAVREQIFNKNYQQILKLEAESNGECHFEVNNQTDWTEEEKEGLKGYTSPLGKKFSTLPPKLSSSGALTYPNSLDYRTLNAVSPVKNQGNCGSCWAFSTTALYESLLMMATSTTYDLSEQYVLQCSGSANSCSGGYPYEALDKIEVHGIPLEQAYPYRVSDSYYSTSNICSTNNNYVKLSKTITNSSHYTNLSDASLKQLLYEYGPVSVGMYTNYAFNYYSSGVFSNCPYYVNSLNHAVLLIGYTSQGNWIIKNSWGTTWGDGGYAIISKTYNCGLTSYVDVLEADWSGYHDSSDGSDGSDNGENNNDDNNNNDEDSDSDTTYLNYSVSMTDSYGDGWNGLVLGIKQEGAWTSTFGSQFTSGSSYSPVTLQVKANKHAILEVAVYASYTNEVGFTLTNENGSSLYFRCPGSNFPQSTIFLQWCPGNNCPTPTTFDLKIYLTDSYGDGWNGNVLALKQNGTIVGTFGEGFTSGHNSGPVNLSIPSGVSTNIVVQTLGTYRSEVGFTIKDSENNVLFTRLSGNYFYSNTILGTFCPGCINAANIRTAPTSEQQRNKKEEINVKSNDTTQPPQENTQSQQTNDSNKENQKLNVGLVVSTSILGFLSLFFIILSVGLFVLWKNDRKLLYKSHSMMQEQGPLIDKSSENSQKRDRIIKLEESEQKIGIQREELGHEHEHQQSTECKN